MDHEGPIASGQRLQQRRCIDVPFPYRHIEGDVVTRAAVFTPTAAPGASPAAPHGARPECLATND